MKRIKNMFSILTKGQNLKSKLKIDTKHKNYNSQADCSCVAVKNKLVSMS